LRLFVRIIAAVQFVAWWPVVARDEIIGGVVIVLAVEAASSAIAGPSKSACNTRPRWSKS